MRGSALQAQRVFSGGPLHRWPFVVALATVLSCATVEEKPTGPIIDSLEIEGTKQISQRQLKKKILTEASSFFASWVWFVDEKHFDDNTWQADLRRIERYYQANGYYQARVLEEGAEPAKEGHVKLHVSLVEGGQAKVSRFGIEGLEPLPEPQRLKLVDSLPIKVGRPFLEDEWQTTKAQLKQSLLELGFAEATVEGEAVVDVDRLSVDVGLWAELRQRYRFGKVFVANSANAKVPSKVIADEVEDAIEGYDWFDPRALNTAQARLFNMGVFSAVRVTGGPPEQSLGVVPVVVDVREAKFQSVRFGGGIGSDLVRDEARFIGEYTNRNFFGGLRRYTLRGKVGWAFLAGSTGGFPLFRGVFENATRVEGATNGPIFRLTNEFEQPRFFAQHVNLQASVEAGRQLEPSFAALGGTASVGVVWAPRVDVSIRPSYNFTYYRLSQSVVAGSLGAQDAFLGCGTDCFISYFEQTVVWDRRDNVLQPKNGWYLGLSLQEGGSSVPIPGSGPAPGMEKTQFRFFTYFRLLPEARGYVSFTKDNKLTVATRVRLGGLWTVMNSDGSPVNAPIPVRFFSGGNDMRGFSGRRLSPYDLAQAPCPSGQDCPDPYSFPVGGSSLFEASLELRWNVWGDLTLATFADYGFVSNKPVGLHLFTSANLALGIGARYQTPVGPIRLDVAVRVPGIGTVLDRSQISSTNMIDPMKVPAPACVFWGDAKSLPGGPEGICAFHVSIGEAF